MSTSTSTSNAASLPPRIKLNQPGSAGTGQRTYTGKHPPPGHSSRSNGSGTKTRPPPLPSPTPTISGGNAGNGGGANGVMGVNSSGARISGRRGATSRAGGPGKLKGGNVDDRGKGAGGDNETEAETIVLRQTKKLPLKPYINTTSVILKKYQGQPPSIVLHLHPQHFRFEGQDGGFGYGSPMRAILECLRSEIIPHEVVEEFRDAGTRFYDGCLIVQIHDHRSASTASSSKANDNKVIPHSIHNYNESLTPSPFVPFPKEKLVPPVGSQSSLGASQKKTVGSDKKDASLSSSDAKKEKGEKDSKTEKKIRIFTTVLHPTQLTLHADMAIMASTPVPPRLNPCSRSQQSSSTPTSTSMPVPPAPTGLTINTSSAGLSTKTILNDKTALNFEATALLATSPALVLTPARGPEHAQTILRTLRNPHNSFPMPAPKSRKRTTAELEADEAQAVQEERFLLIMDERHSGHTPLVPESAVGDGSGVGGGFEPDFKRFKLIERIKSQQAEEKKAKMAEKDRQHRQEQEQRARERKREEVEAARRMPASRTSQHGSPVLAQGLIAGAATTAAQVNGITATARPGSSGSVQSQSGQQVGAMRLQQQQHPLAQQQVQRQQAQAQQQQSQQQQQAQQTQQQQQAQVQVQAQVQAQAQQAQQQRAQQQQAHLSGQQPQMQHHPISQPGANAATPLTTAQYTGSMHIQQQQQRVLSQHAQPNGQSPRPHHQSPHLAQQSPHLTQQSPHLAQQSLHLQHSSPRIQQHAAIQQQQQQQQQQMHLQMQQPQFAAAQLQGANMNNTNMSGVRAATIGKTALHHPRPQQVPQQQGYQLQDLSNFHLGGNGIAMGGAGVHQLPSGMGGQMPRGMGQSVMTNMVNMRDGAQGMGMGRGGARP